LLNRPSLRTLINKKNLVGAEIGVGGGKNAFNILENLSIEKLYLIDPYRPGEEVMVVLATGKFDEAKERLEEFEDKIVWLKYISREAAKYIEDEELDFVYIDGNHKYEYVKQDIRIYYKKVKKNGLIAGHDYDMSDRHFDHGNNVRKAVNEVVDSLGVTLYVGKCAERESQLDWWFFK